MEAAYFQVYLWKQAVEKAKSTDVDKVVEAIRGQEFDAPEGKVQVDRNNNHSWKRPRRFEIVAESKEWNPPDPYAALLNP